MFEFSILGERTRSEKRLCDTCRHSLVVKGTKQSDEKVYCNVPISGTVVHPFRVVECSDYVSKIGMTLYEAEDKGWVLETKGGRVIGFKPPVRDE